MLKIKNIIFIILSIIIFVAVIFSNNKGTGSDPRGTLLVSEAIITNGTIKLDHYGPKILNSYDRLVYKKNDHYYYYFPIGTSLASLPFVAVAHTMGIDMVTYEAAGQIFIAAFTSAVTLLILIKFASLFIHDKSALIIATAFWFGTSLSSTAGTALWSHNFATLFALLAIYLSIRAIKLNESQPYFLIGVLLFSAYLCRPTMALLSPFVLLFILSYSKSAALKTGSVVALFLAGFSLFSMYEFGQILPDYYLPKRLEGGHFYDALYGNLFSPARGLFIYSPFIIFTWLFFKYSEKSWGLKKTWLLIAVAWPLVHLISISRFPHWWAGSSYGARFMTDIVPGIFLLTLYTWPTNFKHIAAKLLTVPLSISIIFAIFINVQQGMFNKYAALWNDEPAIDTYPEYLFDWTYPQFLSNKEGHTSRLIRHGMKTLQPISPGQIQSHTSKTIIYLDWSNPESDLRWSAGNKSEIIFQIDSAEKFKGVIRMYSYTLGEQRIAVTLNGAKIYSGIYAAWGKELDIHFNNKLLKNGINTLTFDFPDAHQSKNGDPRVLAFAIKYFKIN